MSVEAQTLRPLEPEIERRLTYRRRLKLLNFIAIGAMIIYSLLTLFPFFVLAVRSTVPTTEATTLHLWIPEAEELNLNQQVGNLAVFYRLDLEDLKVAIGIPLTDFIGARTSLNDLIEEYDLDEQEVRGFFAGFYTWNGWNIILASEFFGALIRTLLVTVVSLVGLTILSIFTGYGLAGLHRRDQRIVYSIYLLQMVIPAMLILLPQFVMIQWISNLFPGFSEPGLTRSGVQLGSIVAINIKGTAFSVMIFTAYITGLPRDLEESAMLDGASRLQYVRHILLPLLKVPIVGLIVIQLPLIYNQFLEPFVYLDPDNSTLLPFIQSMVGVFSTNFQVIYASILASILPLLIVYIVFRRFFIRGAMAGAVKG